jgi:putative ABC transport system permease protein
MLMTLAYRSLMARKTSVLMTVLALVVSISVLISVEHIRVQSKTSFANTVSGTDLIVGARTGSLNLLLYSVFRVGSPTNNIAWSTFEDISQSAEIEWAIPLSLGDSHRGYRVLGTDERYFRHFKYGNKHALTFREGRAFRGGSGSRGQGSEGRGSEGKSSVDQSHFEVVLGAAVAQQLNYALGEQILLSHGIASASFNQHKGSPFTVVGILEPTGTPVDQTVHVSLQGLSAVHQGGQFTADPDSITAFMVALKSRMGVFSLQRRVNQYRAEPIMAILPGVALSELWQMMGMLEQTLRLIGGLVLVSALLGLSAMLLSAVRERRHEVQLLRMAGASPLVVFLLSELEVVLMTVTATVCAWGLVSAGLVVGQALLASEFGVFISADIFTASSLWMSGVVLGSAVLIGALPAAAMAMNARRS